MCRYSLLTGASLIYYKKKCRLEERDGLFVCSKCRKGAGSVKKHTRLWCNPTNMRKFRFGGYNDPFPRSSGVQISKVYLFNLTFLLLITYSCFGIK